MSATAEHTFLDRVISLEGVVEPDRFSVLLRITKGELAAAAGLSRDAVSKTRRLQAPATQARLRDVAEIINRILPSPVAASIRPACPRFIPRGGSRLRGSKLNRRSRSRRNR
jgi:hypothetical protein